MLRARRVTDALSEEESGGQSVEVRVAEREMLRTLLDDLAVLPERQRAALVLRELCGLGHGEIGQVLGCSTVAAKRAIFEARRTLLTCRDGRGLACEQVRRELSDGDGRVLRARRLRAHLRACAGCRDFESALRRGPGGLPALVLALPAAARGLLRMLLPAAGTTAAGSASAGGLPAGLLAKALVTLTVAAASAGALRSSQATPARAPAAKSSGHSAAWSAPVVGGPTGVWPGEKMAGRATGQLASAPGVNLVRSGTAERAGTHSLGIAPRTPAQGRDRIGSAPGHAGGSGGGSSAPATAGAGGPGPSSSAPAGAGAKAPGRSGRAPGHARPKTRGRSTSAPRHARPKAPGRRASGPGHARPKAPGRSASAPRHARPKAPGRSASAVGHARPGAPGHAPAAGRRRARATVAGTRGAQRQAATRGPTSRGSVGVPRSPRAARRAGPVAPVRRRQMRRPRPRPRRVEAATAAPRRPAASLAGNRPSLPATDRTPPRASGRRGRATTRASSRDRPDRRARRLRR